MFDDDAAYFAERAARERHMADSSQDMSVRDIHRQLADLYTIKAAQTDAVAPRRVQHA